MRINVHKVVPGGPSYQAFGAPSISSRIHNAAAANSNLHDLDFAGSYHDLGPPPTFAAHEIDDATNLLDDALGD